MSKRLERIAQAKARPPVLTAAIRVQERGVPVSRSFKFTPSPKKRRP